MAEISDSPERIHAEACGPRFDRLLMIETRDRTFAAIGKIAARIESGMTEDEGTAVARQADPHRVMTNFKARAQKIPINEIIDKHLAETGPGPATLNTPRR